MHLLTFTFGDQEHRCALPSMVLLYLYHRRFSWLNIRLYNSLLAIVIAQLLVQEAGGLIF